MDEHPRPAQDIHASVHAWMGVDERRGGGSGEGGEEERRKKEGGSGVHPSQGPDQPISQSTNQLGDRQIDGPTIPRYASFGKRKSAKMCHNAADQPMRSDQRVWYRDVW